ncbi:hypothetical protein AALP_AA3G249200 [Arabis alpina]|uniref:Uncharacterized protein n=1 Tax=Arabis alpina TaxID=50452 RepID=A0A087HBH5_ARAAL|nr:hypothetical protein AALP_AA3G249200 [Arabis alpina]
MFYSSTILQLQFRTLDSNYVFSLRTFITKSKGRFTYLFSGNEREVSFTYFPSIKHSKGIIEIC